MIYKYDVEDGLLKKGSLFHIPFKSVNGYVIKGDNNKLIEKLDYIIDSSRLWIERDLQISTFSISDNVEDETNTLLEKISQLEKSIEDHLQNYQLNHQNINARLDNTNTSVSGLHADIDNCCSDIETVNDKVDSIIKSIAEEQQSNNQNISNLSDMLAGTENKLSSKINDVLRTVSSNYEVLQNDISDLYEDMAEQSDILDLQSKYKALQDEIKAIDLKINQIPDRIEQSELNALQDLLSSTRQSLAMETAQRRRADMEIKLLLSRVIDNMAKLEDIIVGNIGEQDIVEGILNKIKEEFNLSLDRLARITTANMTRAFKLKQEVRNIKGGIL